MESTEVALPPCMLPSISEPIIGTCGSETTLDSVVLSKRLCPWGKVTATETVSFVEVMSEQLASSRQVEEESKADSAVISEEVVTDPTENSDCADDFELAKMLQLEYDKEHGMVQVEVDEESKAISAVISEEVVTDPTEKSDCADDFELAKMLQLEYDKEHDTVLRRQENKYNGDSKVSVSFGKYMCLPDGDFSDNEDEEALELSAKTHWQNFEQAQKAFQAVGKSGVSRQGNNTTTKHDLTVCGRLNALKLMELSSSIITGDGSQFDMKLSNSAYNVLKSHSIAEDRRSHRIFNKKVKSTAEKAVDTKTRIILFKLINNQVVDTLNGCISTGKEACVYHAWGFPEENRVEVPEYAIKVFKTTLNEFQNRDQYIKDDHRFRDRFGKQNPRKIIHMWAEKEMRNLARIKKANIPCPDVVALRDHVLVMTFIGDKMNPAPKLKYVKLPFEDMVIIYEQTCEIMKKMYCECKLVHADMNEYNLLWHKDVLWVIDVSQSVEITHPCAMEFLMRDCRNISTFFEKQGVTNGQNPDKLFTDICGCQPPSY